MSTLSRETASTADQPLANLLFDYHGADIVLRSQDRHHFRVPKTFIVNNSIVLGGVIRKASESSGDANSEVSLPVVQLPESSGILRCLLTFIFPVTPILPPTPEEVMELLSVAQKYQMEAALTHIRGSIGRQNALPTRCLESALHIYTLSHKYGLRPEALQSARAIYLKQSMTVEDLENTFDIMPCASLYYELWKYYKRVRAILLSDLNTFRSSCVHATITSLNCSELSSSRIPRWLDQYIESVGKSLSMFNYAELNVAMARHIKGKANDPRCECASISSQTMRNFWEALESIVDDCFEEAESALSLVQEREDPEAQVYSISSPLEPFDVSDTSLIIRSSDLVDFRVHKSILAMVSPFFKDLLSLPQPSDSEIVDGLPVVRMSESSELLNGLISILYPVPTVIPNSYEKVLYLLAASHKYEMTSVQSSIRAGVNREEYPAPKGAEVFTAYAIASAKDLIPEKENAAHQTLKHRMSFEVIGEGLRFFQGSALRDLVSFRKRCRDNVVTCLDLFLEVQPRGPSKIWVGCPEVMITRASLDNNQQNRVLPKWLNRLLTGIQCDLKLKFIRPLNLFSRIRGEYFTALLNHDTCGFCATVHDKEGSAFLEDLESRLTNALNKVRIDRGSYSGSTYLSP